MSPPMAELPPIFTPSISCAAIPATLATTGSSILVSPRSLTSRCPRPDPRSVMSTPFTHLVLYVTNKTAPFVRPVARVANRPGPFSASIHHPRHIRDTYDPGAERARGGRPSLLRLLPKPRI